MEKRYGLPTAIAMVIGVVLFAGCVYMTVNGSLQYVVFSLFCLALCYVSVRVFLSLSRYVDVDGMSLSARGMTGKVAEFSFDDIERCERDDKRFYIIGKEGKMLAFFNLGWDNGKRLFNALEGYGIVIPDRIRQ